MDQRDAGEQRGRGQPDALGQAREVGVGPWEGPWPPVRGDDDTSVYDERLLAEGDRRNVVDRYRYWRHDAIVADLDARRHAFHVGVENWGHDFNIGSVIRTANAFNAAAFHIVGRRRWNRRGAMVTDRYQHEYHHPSIADLVHWARGSDGRAAAHPHGEAAAQPHGEAAAQPHGEAAAHPHGEVIARPPAHAPGIPIIGIDNLPGSRELETYDLPRRCLLLFGQEGPGLSEAAREAADVVLHISQFGSTRSINAGAAAAIAMHAWVRRHVYDQAPRPTADSPLRPTPD
ncbi:MAG TPA: TrmH family RNA methyltransferase [Segeticoccus sp.]|uniref:TrmH family RNA methyltransferase n=1 Tax=Segeticoccus sp. TaxID=2706531 RepID=UPI002D7EA3C6|nr:TrmH family RNA methyltransferase [Segeticoccus sp.]HET8601051.1 TrmH family RNA methyltransferase [Segeticoccus sp.]